MRTQQENEKLNNAIREEKQLTAIWYAKMSGQTPWNEGERERFSRRFESLEGQIRRQWDIGGEIPTEG